MLRFVRHETALVRLGSHASRPRPFFIVLLATVAVLLAFAGCAVPGSPSASKPQPTATPSAQSILTKAQNVHLADETFTLTMKGTSNGTALDMTGDGKATENPPVLSMTLNMDVSGTKITLEEVMDGTNNATYTRITAPAQLASNTWKKETDSSGSGSGSDMLVRSLYDKLSNTKLLGTEQVNGVATWHIQGTVTGASSGDNETIDIFVRQSDYMPAKMVVHTGGSDSLDATLTYTSFNTGVKIEIPNA
ncbi:MAG TPA: DUF2092 domain-containing protein [Ktedonobacterales bacterium]